MTRFSWVVSEPSLSSSARMISRPPGISSTSERKIHLVSTSQLAASMNARERNTNQHPLPEADFDVVVVPEICLHQRHRGLADQRCHRADRDRVSDPQQHRSGKLRRDLGVLQRVDQGQECAPPMGTMITAVAVLLTHMVMNALASMRPKTIWLGLVPTARIMRRATRRWRCQRCVAKSQNDAAKDKINDGVGIRCGCFADDRRCPVTGEENERQVEM